MLAKPEAQFVGASLIQACPLTDLRVLPISANNPLALDLAGFQQVFAAADPRYARSPEALHTQLLGARNKGSVQSGPSTSMP